MKIVQIVESGNSFGGKFPETLTLVPKPYTSKTDRESTEGEMRLKYFFYNQNIPSKFNATGLKISTKSTGLGSLLCKVNYWHIRTNTNFLVLVLTSTLINGLIYCPFVTDTLSKTQHFVTSYETTAFTNPIIIR